MDKKLGRKNYQWQMEAPLTKAPADPSQENTAAASGVAVAGFLGGESLDLNHKAGSSDVRSLEHWQEGGPLEALDGFEALRIKTSKNVRHTSRAHQSWNEFCTVL